MNRAIDRAEEKGRDSRVIEEAELRGLGDCVFVCVHGRAGWRSEEEERGM